MIISLLMILKTFGRKYLIHIIGLLALGFSVYQFYSFAYDNGYEECKSQWDEYKQLQNEYIASLEEDYEKADQKYSQEKEKLVVQIYNNQNEYNSKLVALERDYSLKLHQSETRADYYQYLSQAQDSTVGNLANYTARFDRTIVEGQQVVRELRELIKLRDEQLRKCGAELKLIVGDDNGN